MTIAVIDDEPQVRGALERLLKALGHRAETYPSAEDFLSAAETSKTTCLLLDMQLGALPGLDVVRHALVKSLRLPVILISASDEKLVARQAESLGCVAYLRKPFSASQLQEALEKVQAVTAPQR
jgi:FixJ family two-component response regulator